MKRKTFTSFSLKEKTNGISLNDFSPIRKKDEINDRDNTNKLEEEMKDAEIEKYLNHTFIIILHNY